jgi:metal-responsive CopG/Arc/MetJ family transcriptional regulator
MSDVIQVNVSMPKEDADDLDRMAHEMGFDNRSAFVRWMTRQEKARRYSQPNPVITIEEAQAAADSMEKC